MRRLAAKTFAPTKPEPVSSPAREPFLPMPEHDVVVGTKVRWDGHSPIAGEEVREVFWLADRQFVVTASSLWEIDHNVAHLVIPTDRTVQ